MIDFLSSFVATYTLVFVLSLVLYLEHVMLATRSLRGLVWVVLMVAGVVLQLGILHSLMARTLLMGILMSIGLMPRVVAYVRAVYDHPEYRIPAGKGMRVYLHHFLWPAVQVAVALAPLIVVAATPYDKPLGISEILAAVLCLAGIGLYAAVPRYYRIGSIVHWWAIFAIAAMTSYGILTIVSPVILTIIVLHRSKAMRTL